VKLVYCSIARTNHPRGAAHECVRVALPAHEFRDGSGRRKAETVRSSAYRSESRASRARRAWQARQWLMELLQHHQRQTLWRMVSSCEHHRRGSGVMSKPKREAWMGAHWAKTACTTAAEAAARSASGWRRLASCTCMQQWRITLSAGCARATMLGWEQPSWSARGILLCSRPGARDRSGAAPSHLGAMVWISAAVSSQPAAPRAVNQEARSPTLNTRHGQGVTSRGNGREAVLNCELSRCGAWSLDAQRTSRLPTWGMKQKLPPGCFQT
jgi:hypothetical protein